MKTFDDFIEDMETNEELIHKANILLTNCGNEESKIDCQVLIFLSSNNAYLLKIIVTFMFIYTFINKVTCVKSNHTRIVNPTCFISIASTSN